MYFRFYIDPETGLPHIFNHGVDEGEKEKMMTNPINKFPPGWDEERVQSVIKYYDALNEEEAIAEAEAAYEDPSKTVMLIPNELVPAVTALLAKHGA